MSEKPGESEEDIFDRVVEELRAGRSMDSLSPEESEVFSTKARELDGSPVPGTSVKRENWDPESPVSALTSQKAFEKFMEENLEDFARAMPPKAKFMLIVLGRELKSHRPAARMQAARAMGELLGVMKRGKDGSIRPDTGTTGGTLPEELESLLERSED